MDPTVVSMAALGILILAIGLTTYRRDAGARSGALKLAVFGPALVASGLAAFAAEHFTAGPALARIVPKFMPAPLALTYLVGAAHIAAASSFVARRYVWLSSLWLALMFGLFVVLMDLPGAIARPGAHIAWSLVTRETTFAIGALVLYATVTRAERSEFFVRVASVAQNWMAAVLVFYGIENLVFPQFTPGVPDVTPTPAWVPAPQLIAYVVGTLFVVFGLLMFSRRFVASACVGVAITLIALTIGIFVPDFFIVSTARAQVNSLNFVFDTLLFAGTVLVIGNALTPREERSR